MNESGSLLTPHISTPALYHPRKVAFVCPDSRYRRLRSLSTGAYRSNSGCMGVKSERVLISESIEATPINHATYVRARISIHVACPGAMR